MKSVGFLGDIVLTLKREWLQCIVHISFGSHPFCREYHDGVELLREIECWLHTNHVGYAMFDAWGFPKFPAGNVPVTFSADEAEKAMAYRVFCNKLGLGAQMHMTRIVVPDHPSLTPPPVQLAYF